jgi:hypothetical protein
VQREATVPDDDGVARVGAAAVADDDLAVLGQDIDHLALAFITPLQSDDTRIHWTGISPNLPAVPRKDKPR